MSTHAIPLQAPRRLSLLVLCTALLDSAPAVTQFISRRGQPQ